MGIVYGSSQRKQSSTETQMTLPRLPKQKELPDVRSSSGSVLPEFQSYRQEIESIQATAHAFQYVGAMIMWHRPPGAIFTEIHQMQRVADANTFYSAGKQLERLASERRKDYLEKAETAAKTSASPRGEPFPEETEAVKSAAVIISKALEERDARTAAMRKPLRNAP